MPWILLLFAGGVLFVHTYIMGFAGGNRGIPDFDRKIAARAALERDAYLRAGAGPDRFAIVRHGGRGYDALSVRYASRGEAEHAIRQRGGAPRTADNAGSGVGYYVFDVGQPVRVDPPTDPIDIFFMSN